MKNIIIIILVFTEIMAYSQYSIDSSRLDLHGGKTPSLIWSPNGDQLVFYTRPGTPEKTYFRRKGVADSVFGDEFWVKTSSTYIVAGIFRNDSITEAAFSGSATVVIYETKNNGASWTYKKSYASTDNAMYFSGYTPYMYQEGDTVKLFFSKMIDSHIFGAAPHVYYAKKVDNTWLTDPVFKFDGAVTGVLENLDTICVFTQKGIQNSVDNGNSFSFKEKTCDFTYCYYKPEDMAFNDDRQMFALHNYDYGIAPNNKHLNMITSVDMGQNWSDPQIVVLEPSFSMFCPKIAVSSNDILVVYVREGKSEIHALISRDMGNSWTGPHIIGKVPSGYNLEQTAPSWVHLSNYNNRFAITYSIKNQLNDSCIAILKEISLSQEPVGILNNNNLSELIVYPNPVKDVLFLSNDFVMKNAVYEIFSVKGEKILTGKLLCNSINVSKLKNGLWYLHLLNNEKSFVKLFSKE